jgi:hypothetical protein
MVGLGAQEILVLALCCGFPFVGGVVVLVLVLSQKRNAARPRPDGDWDAPDDDR